MKDINLTSTPLEFPDDDPVTNEVCLRGNCDSISIDKQCFEKNKTSSGG